MLYDLLDKLQECILYCDTDGIVFASSEGEWLAAPYLGGLDR